MEMLSTLNSRLMRAKIIRKVQAAMSGIESSGRRAARIGVAIRIALAASTAIALAGCGKPAAVVHGHSFDLTLGDYSIAPADIDAAPGDYTVVVSNVGQRTHNVVVTLNGIRIGATTKPLYPGQKSSFPLTLVPGTYRLASTILNDQALGQYACLTVK